MERWVWLLLLLALADPARAQDGQEVYTQRCAQCHEGDARAPVRAVIAALTQERIVAALETGLMRAQGETLTQAEKQAVARYLSPTTAAVGGASSVARCTSAPRLG